MDVTVQPAKLKRVVPVTVKNEKDAWEGTDEDGKPIRRDFTFNFYVLLKSDVDNDEAFPLVVSFKRTSTQAGKQVATHLFKMAALGKATYSQTLKLSVRKEKKDANTYAILQAEKGEKAAENGLVEAKRWLDILNTMSHTVDEEEADEVAPQAKYAAPQTMSQDNVGF